jgi:chemotaxis signal transduction protein
VSETESSIGVSPTVGTAAALRRSFDESFAAPAALLRVPVEDLLAIRVASDPYAVRLSEIAGLHVDIQIVPVPSPAGQLLGIVGIRGVMMPIYDLAALLRYPRAESPRWIVFARGTQRVGFAFDTFESHLQVSQGSMATGDGEDKGARATAPQTQGTVRAGGSLRPIIHLASVVAMIGDINS